MPIVSLGNLFSFIIALIIAIRLFLAYRETKNEQIKNFSKSFGMISLFFLCAAAPGILTQDIFLAGIFNIVAIVFILASVAFLSIVIFNLFKLKRFQTIYLLFIIFITLVSVILRIFGPIPLKKIDVEIFTFWIRHHDPYMAISFIIIGLTVFLSTFGGGIFFLYYGFRERINKFIFHRSLSIGGGMILLSLAAATTSLGPTITATALVVSSALASIGMLIMFFGILYKKEKV